MEYAGENRIKNDVTARDCWLGEPWCDLFRRMVRLEPKQRPTIEEVLAHSALWGAEEQLR